MKNRAIQSFCIHGHFYQPPREDPLTGEVPLEPGAAPFRNWNERINDQCYKPNAELGNFEHISFDVGPTLMEWLAENDPVTLGKIIEQDQMNYQKYGIGNAMAQSFHHTILPLATRQDKITQVLWGIASFEFYYGHKPQGMWLPECAADLETLEVLADCGIEFTILAPWQAEADHIDPLQVYRVPLPNSKGIQVIFYNQDLSTRISFDPGATSNADSFIMQHLTPNFKLKSSGGDNGQFLVVASDGEVYGHHQPFRDKFLAYLLDGALKNQPLQATFPGLWMAQHPGSKEINIRQNTSWSCHHGVVRWSGACDCTPNGEWKAPLRKAFNQIAKAVDDLYVEFLKPFMIDPWLLRHRLCDVFYGRQSAEELITGFVGHKLPDSDLNKIQILLSAQYERQRIFTSCGWFFDDFDRIEPRNNVAYAAEAIWLTFLATGVDLSQKAKDYLKPVKSWRSGLGADQVFNYHLDRARVMMGIRQVRERKGKSRD